MTNQPNKHLFAEMLVPHKNCSLLSLKDKYKGDMSMSTKPLFSSNLGKCVVNFSISTNRFDDFCDDLKAKRNNMEIIDYKLSSGHSTIYCMVTDRIFNILEEMGQERPPSFLSEHDLLNSRFPFNRLVEYFDVAVPDETYFIDNVIQKLNKEAIGKKIDWRIREGLEKKLMPGLSLYQHYLVDETLKTEYFNSGNKKELNSISEKLKVNIDVLKKDIDEVGGDLCLRFIEYTRKDS